MAILNIKGYEVILDDDLACDIDPSKWECRESGGKPYFRTVSRVNKTRKTVWLHHVAVLKTSEPVVDHKDGNTLNNLRSNLRKCEIAENARNRVKARNNKSGYKGVYRCNFNEPKPWHCQIRVGGKRKHIGYYATAVEAGIAYNKAALEYYGEFANLNKVEV